MNEENQNATVLLWQAKQALIDQPEFIEYVRRVYTIDPGGYPFLAYVGVNFTADKIKNFKFYFSFFRDLTSDEIDALLPVPDRGRFDELHRAWHPSRQYGALHRGTTFALKVNPDGGLTYYYHFRIPGLMLGPPERLAIAPSDHDNYHGVCEEFTGSKRHLKRYYYCHDRETIAHTLDVAGFGAMRDEVRNIGMLEYIESDGRDKLEWITQSPNLIRELTDLGPPRLRSALAVVCRGCRVDLFGPGSARDGGDHALYFIDVRAPLHPGGYMFDGVRPFFTRYLRIDDPAT